MAVSTADCSCLRMLIRIMTGFLQIIPMRVSRISGRRGCTQSLLLTCLRQTSKLCLATTHVSIWNLDCLPALHLLFYLNFIFFSELGLLLEVWLGCWFRKERSIFFVHELHFYLFNFACVFCFSNFCPSIAYLDMSIFFLIELQRWCLSMVLLAVVEWFLVHRFILNCASGCAWTSFSFLLQLIFLVQLE